MHSGLHQLSDLPRREKSIAFDVNGIQMLVTVAFTITECELS